MQPTPTPPTPSSSSSEDGGAPPRRGRLVRRALLGLGLVAGAQTGLAAPGHARGCECAVPTWSAQPAPPAAPVEGPTLRVATWNIHSGLGPRLTRREPRATVEAHLRRIARDLAAAAPADAPLDLVGLNEVDFVAARSGDLDQGEFLAAELGRLTGARWSLVRGVTWERADARFGNALLTRHPVRASTAIRYDDGAPATREGEPLPPVRSPGPLERLLREARGAVVATVDVPGLGPVDALVTHLDAFSQGDREAQAVHLLRRHIAPGRTTVLLGDLNAVPTPQTLGRRPFRDDLTHDLLTSGDLADARVVLAARAGDEGLGPWATFPAVAPVWPLDGALATLDLVPVEAAAFGGDASDHRAFAVTLRRAPDDAARRAFRAWHDAVRRRQLARLERCRVEPVALSLGTSTQPRSTDRRRLLVDLSGFRDLLRTGAPR